MKNILILLVIFGAFMHFKSKEQSPEIPIETNKTERYVSPYANMPTSSSNGFTCDGRQHCSQMRSCEEAEYFLNNCPNVKMDGDQDGEPCEDQWC